MAVLAPAIRHVREAEGEWSTSSEVAAVLGISRSRLRRIGNRHPELGPGGVTFLNGLKIHVYGDRDVAALDAYLSGHYPGRTNSRRASLGRPAIRTPEEQRAHRRGVALARYHRRRAEELAAAGDLTGAVRASERAEEIAAEPERLEVL